MIDGSGLRPAHYRALMNLYCNRFGMELAVFERAHGLGELTQWADERQMALSAGHDYRTITAVML